MRSAVNTMREWSSMRMPGGGAVEPCRGNLWPSAEADCAALRREIVQAVDVPVIGTGGMMSGRDAADVDGGCDGCGRG